MEKIEIKNEVKPSNKEPAEKKEFVHRTLVDHQRIKLEKLMKNPEKPVIIPESPRERDFNASVPTFVRNVMGSSAGAGSGEFHVYRNLRRKEYARLKGIEEKSRREEMDENWKAKLEQNEREAEERTAKKREKRLKKKQHGGNKKPKVEEKKEWKPLSDDELLNEPSDEENSNDEKEKSEKSESTNEESTKNDDETTKKDDDDSRSKEEN
ncbi:PRKR-interacting protein 1 homolog [Culicoides brevitarsis]|uniref:PRKR-interacting protein 1 homolog n=1 Tax=Culicoides brevitarsis TaxID=469753 RepID=UPI00307CBD9C